MHQQLARGLFFVAFGALGWALGRDLPVGTAGDMGVGYVPRALSIGCIGVGAVLLLATLLSREPPQPIAFAWKAMAIATILVLAFAILLPVAGLPLTIVAVVLAASVSGEAFDWRVLTATAVLLALGSTVLFHTLLRLQVPIWPSW